MRESMEKLLSVPSGLKWEALGETRPSEGRELKSSALQEALRSKTEFTQDEWNSFGIGDLYIADFIKSGDSYFKPAGVSLS